jgi:hypothetical protein
MSGMEDITFAGNPYVVSGGATLTEDPYTYASENPLHVAFAISFVILLYMVATGKFSSSFSSIRSSMADFRKFDQIQEHQAGSWFGGLLTYNGHY